MKILLLKSWKNNIGNTVVDKGARALLDRAIPEASITELSGYNRYTSARTSQMNGNHSSARKNHKNTSWVKKWKPDEKTVNLIEFLNPDVAILPGCVLRTAYPVHEPALEHLAARNIPLVFLGVAGGGYSEETVSYVRKSLNQLNPDVLISRDELTHRTYADVFKRTHRGIDCGFFVNDWYSPEEANTEFSVHTFDKTEPPNLETPGQTIEVTHSPFDAPMSNPKNGVPEHSDSFTEPENFSSDSLRDYLLLYGNCLETHSDRLHACISTLAFGNKAKLYYETVRSRLFDRLARRDILEQGKQRIENERVELNLEILEDEKRKEIRNVKEILENQL